MLMLMSMLDWINGGVQAGKGQRQRELKVCSMTNEVTGSAWS